MFNGLIARLSPLGRVRLEVPSRSDRGGKGVSKEYYKEVTRAHAGDREDKRADCDDTRAVVEGYGRRRVKYLKDEVESSDSSLSLSLLLVQRNFVQRFGSDFNCGARSRSG